MNAAERTKLKIAESMKALMDTHSVEKITVKQIVDQIGVTRQTFYRYFKDKYDVINWYFDVLASRSFKQMGVSLTLREVFVKKYTHMQAAGNFFPSAFRSREQNCLLEYDYNSLYQFFKAFIHKTTRCEVTERIDFVLKLYCSGAMYMTMCWAQEGMIDPPEQMADNLIAALPEPLKKVFPL